MATLGSLEICTRLGFGLKIVVGLRPITKQIGNPLGQRPICEQGGPFKRRLISEQDFLYFKVIYF